MAAPQTALRALRKTTTSQTPRRSLSTQSLSNLNRTIARSTLSTPLSAIRSAFRQQTRRQTADAMAASSSGTSGAQPTQSAFQRLWNSPVGIKTVHFWAPIAKWGVVLAGVSDLFRPASALSLQQNLALMATGAIWTRWCFVIKPRNVFLATVNFFLFLNGAMQATRVLHWRSQQSNESVAAATGEAVKEEGQILKGMVEHPEKSFEKAEKNVKTGK